MFILKSLDGLTELTQCETPCEAIEKADALWIGSGGNVKITDGEGRDYSPDQFRAVYNTQSGPTTSGRIIAGSLGRLRANPISISLGDKRARL